MKFFIPNVPVAEYAATYEGIIKSVREQMRVTVAPRRIQSLSYVHDKKRFKVEVGELDPQMGDYEVFAILESKPYIVFTRCPDGSAGITILVSNHEVTEVVDFE